jgi:hypothetical protein
MKRKLVTLFLTTVAVVALTPSTFARPSHSEERFYFDESGNQVGYGYSSCYSVFPYQEGEETGRYTAFTESCPWTFEPPFTCEEFGLITTPCPLNCVTGSYYMSVIIYLDFVDPFGCLFVYQ